MESVQRLTDRQRQMDKDRRTKTDRQRQTDKDRWTKTDRQRRTSIDRTHHLPIADMLLNELC